MNINDIYQILKTHTGLVGGIIFLLLTLIQITPIKVNPWSWIGKVIGKLLNAEVSGKVDTISKEVDDLSKEVKSLSSELSEFKEEVKENDIVSCRVRILRFADEIKKDTEHEIDKERFEQTIHDIDKYEEYCKTHEGFSNGVAVLNIAKIRDEYKRRFL